MPENFTTPILFLIYNRPETAQRTFSRIQEIRPRYLYLAADGPRDKVLGDDKLCAQTRRLILAAIDWECEVKTLFRETNLGVGRAVSGALDWFFQNVDQGIIIEDDCLATNSFFYFCQELLIRYKDQENIFLISGNKNVAASQRAASDYFFSQLPSAWGWATWRRVWQKYDFNLTGLPEFLEQKTIAKIFSKKEQQEYWLDLFLEMKNQKRNNWDYQLAFLCFQQGGLSIIPGINLVINIGWSYEPKNVTLIDQPGPLNLNHPTRIETNPEYDAQAAASLITGRYRLKKFLKKIKLFNAAKGLYKKLYADRPLHQ